ncbi:MAG: hypothetical protein IH948_07560 [Bacteroidetes bacterium]|nr:hypothetical protein [Bacteroidota bacterium]
MKRFLFTILLIIPILSFGTNQRSDILRYNGTKLRLHTSWAYPSIIQLYFSQKETKYPFSMISTANYRGHIATWEIENNRLILTEIKIGKVKHNAEEYGITSNMDTLKGVDKVFADWFTGIITCDEASDKETDETYFFNIVKGKVIDAQIIGSKDY